MNHLHQLTDLMIKEGLDPLVISTFSAYYNQLLSGTTGLISKSEIMPPSSNSVISLESLSNCNTDIYQKVVCIKLNGGLGTSMGLSKAKSLLPVKKDLSFLDIIVNQILHIRKNSNTDIPLMFMNSFNTEADTMLALEKYQTIRLHDIPLSFIQNKFPKIIQSDFSPFRDKDEHLNWNPPGHGDIYMTLAFSGIINQLLDKGYQYLFISNADNLGATLLPTIPNYMKENKVPFVMEVCKRTAMDSKGGHLAQTQNDLLLLREVAQCPENELSEFQDIHLYSYFNTNNLWVDLKALKDIMMDNNGLFLLPIILNSKTVNGTKVYQIETAMGSAINNFVGAKAVLVERDRFIPVKKTNDLLLLWSDCYNLNHDYILTKDSRCPELPYIDLDPTYYGTIDMLQKRISEPISLLGCINLKVTGNITFKERVNITGNVELEADLPTTLANIRIKS